MSLPPRSDGPRTRTLLDLWRSSLVPAILLLSLLAGCRTENPLANLPRPDLENLDPPIQRQYEQRLGTLEGLLEADPSPAEAARAWGDLGHWYFAHGFPTGAELSYREAARLQPDDPRWAYHRARAAQQASDLEGALGHYDRAVDLGAEPAAARIRRGELLLELGRPEEAALDFRAVLEEDATVARALAGLGQVALAQEDPQGAAESFEAALRLQPAASNTRYALASAYRRLGEVEKARQTLAQVPEDNRLQTPLLLEDPWMVEVQELAVGLAGYQNQGHRALAEGRLRDAAEAFERATEIDPDSVSAHLNLALVEKRLGDLQAAEATVRDALERSPDAARARVMLAEILLATRRPGPALDELVQAATVDPDNELARFNLALLLLQAGRADQAIDHFRAARRLMPSSVPARQGLAVALFSSGRGGEAVETLEEDVRALPEEPFLRLLLTRYLATAPETTGPRLERALSLARSQVEAQATVTTAETLAMVLAASGRWAEAARWQRAAVQALSPDAPEASRDLAIRRLELYEDERAVTVPWETDESFLDSPLEGPPD